MYQCINVCKHVTKMYVLMHTGTRVLMCMYVCMYAYVIGFILTLQKRNSIGRATYLSMQGDPIDLAAIYSRAARCSAS